MNNMKRLTLYLLLFCSLMSVAQSSFVMKYYNGGIDSTATFSKIGFSSDGYDYSVVATDNNSSRQLNIGNIKSISRYDLKLANASGEEVQTLLEDKSIQQTEDILSVINALNKNESVEKAYTINDHDLIVDFTDEETIIYPMITLKDPFMEEQNGTTSRKKSGYSYKWPSKDYEKKNENILVLNYFSDNPEREVQNMLIEAIMDKFYEQGYGIVLKKYEDMTKDGIDEAFRSNYIYSYKAILVFGHGTLFYDVINHSCLITADNASKSDEVKYFDNFHKSNKKVIKLKDLLSYLPNDCLVYLGACNSNYGPQNETCIMREREKRLKVLYI